MKRKLTALILSGAVTAASLMSLPAAAYKGFEFIEARFRDENIYTLPVDYSLWDNFIKYDLRITDYDELSDYEKELCSFIFETEQSAGWTVRCERARRILAHDEHIGERITVDRLEGAYGIWDNYSPDKVGWQSYIHCVPDIKYLDMSEERSIFWLDEKGEEYVVVAVEGVNNIHNYPSFTVIEYDEKGRLYGYEVEASKVPFGELIRNYNFVPLDYSEAIEYEGNYYYITSENTAVLLRSGQSNPFETEDIEPVTEPCIIPEEINGCPVTAIESHAFLNAPYTEIVLPDTIRSIDRYAFYGCQNLESINFPHGLEYIGSSAFVGLRLDKVDIDCPELYISRGAFYASTMTELNVNARIIDESAFRYCPELKNVTFGENIQKIDVNAFTDCAALENITFSPSVKAIGQGAFARDIRQGAKSITIPPTVEIIGALPRALGDFGSGLDTSTHPLTDKPKCVFDEDCTIYGYRGTEAERYAKEWELEFIELEAKKGDVNLDGELSIADVVAMQSYLLGRKAKNTAYMDLNGDGSADIFDMIRIRELVLTAQNSTTE